MTLQANRSKQQQAKHTPSEPPKAALLAAATLLWEQQAAAGPIFAALYNAWEAGYSAAKAEGR